MGLLDAPDAPAAFDFADASGSLAVRPVDSVDKPFGRLAIVEKHRLAGRHCAGNSAHAGRVFLARDEVERARRQCNSGFNFDNHFYSFVWPCDIASVSEWCQTLQTMSSVFSEKTQNNCTAQATPIDRGAKVGQHGRMTKQEAIKFYGSGAALARALGLTRQAVSLWPDIVPDLYQYKLQVLTRGKLKAAQ